jgi:hypothetical protein
MLLRNALHKASSHVSLSAKGVHSTAGDQVFNIAMVGLGFGAEFIPIHQAHPNANVVAVCRRNKTEMDALADEFGIEKRYTDLDELLKDPAIDAVHINSPIGDHASQSLKALRAGKHVMCTVPMATTIAECKEICQVVDETGLKFMSKSIVEVVGGGQPASSAAALPSGERSPSQWRV